MADLEKDVRSGAESERPAVLCLVSVFYLSPRHRLRFAPFSPGGLNPGASSRNPRWPKRSRRVSEGKHFGTSLSVDGKGGSSS